MKKEPLKNKKIDCCDGIRNTDDYYFENDLKSAVEWLKEKMDYESEDSRNAYSTNRNIDLGIAKRLINEAFPDIYPPGDLTIHD